MADQIRYDLLAQDALRSVVRRVLTDVARDGLPGEHHFYISFDTRAPGVRLPQFMRDKYPEEMTVVLQHQFWDLKVTEEAFEVGLSFGGVPDRLAVPFAALKGFFDPSVKFGLQFELAADADTSELPEVPADVVRPGPGAAGRPSRGAASEPALADASATDGPEADKAGGAEVVRLDVFRNKK